ncbi:hypothetical protein DW721_00560 [Clostridium sp. AM27-31LB]|uniref:hypothetical protein n=1 Tax=Clostridium sp. AM27-31LB TaxID=2293026 RepID=UPI000E46EB99|nr:hypothetical protein [Clostridium sp. AM27-31LB]RHT95901.1 hypothetical protein DW721_00560 [Clostridium sp. AM27-31LB]
MAFCRYCGKQLKNGEKCNCEQSKKREIEFAKEQEQLRKQYYMQKQKEQNRKINNQGGVPGQQQINGNHLGGVSGQQPIRGNYPGGVSGQQPINGNYPGEVPGQQPIRGNYPGGAPGQQPIRGNYPGGAPGQQPNGNYPGGYPGQQQINGDYPGQQPINGCYSGWNQVPQPNGNQGNISQMASGIGKRILSTAVDTFRSPLNAVKNLGNSNSIAESLIISGISMFVLLIELLIACAIIGANLEDQIFGSVFQDMLNSVMKYAILILIGMFLWGLLVAGVMFVVSKYLFHENITFIQTYAVIAVKTLAGVILFTAYVIFFIAMMYVVKIFNSDIGAIIMLIVMLLVIPIVMFTNFIFLYGYFEVLEREPSVKLYEILVMHIVLFIVSLIVGKILGYFIQQAISDSLSGIGGWLLSGLFS